MPDILDRRQERVLGSLSDISNGLRCCRYKPPRSFPGRRDSRGADVGHPRHGTDQDVARDLKRPNGYDLDAVNRTQEHAWDCTCVQSPAHRLAVRVHASIRHPTLRTSTGPSPRSRHVRLLSVKNAASTSQWRNRNVTYSPLN